MRKIILVLFFALIASITFSQESNYSDFKKKFLDFENFSFNDFPSNIFPGKNNISENNVLKYLFTRNKQDASPKKYSYNYGPIFESNNHDCLIVQKNTEAPGDTYYTHNVGETLLVIFNKTGKRLSQTSIAKIGDMFYSIISSPNDSTIYVVQSRIIDAPPKEPYYVTVDYLKFTIKPDGSVAQTKYKPSTKGELIFEQNDIKKQIDRFILVDGKRQVAVE